MEGESRRRALGPPQPVTTRWDFRTAWPDR
jgi:hypothetical protein